MHRETTLRLLRLPVLFALLACGGCDRSPAPRFTITPKNADLVPEARDGMTVKGEDGAEVRLKGVNDYVAEKFGTLQEPKVWPLLPIDFGGVPAVVEAVTSPTSEEAEKAEDEEKPFGELAVTIKPIAEPVTAGAAGWKSGSYEGRSAAIKSFDAKSGALILTGSFGEGLPEPGDELSLGMGPKLEAGRALFARHCVHCHGPDGAGDGPTARYLEPKPRDFRSGVYKFTSTGAAERASRGDLAATLRHGIPGTSMPAFRQLTDDEIRSLVEYARWLTMRGVYETQLALAAYAAEQTSEHYAEAGKTKEERDALLEDLRSVLENDLVDTAEVAGEDIADAWSAANGQDVVVVPETPRTSDTPESWTRGRDLYLSDKTKCATCHGPYGRGDGPQTESFQIIPGTDETYPLRGLYDAWDHPIKPRDLTQGVYRGGRRPIDLYRRIRAGIKGTPMPGFATLTDEEVWDLVNYVLHAPQESIPEPGEGRVAANGH